MGAMQGMFMALRLANDLFRTINENNVLKVAVTATHAVTQLPTDWRGGYIWITNTSASSYCEVAQTINANAEIDLSVAATTAGASTKVGTYIPPATRQRFQLQEWDKTQPCYLVHEGQASLTLYLERGA